MGAMQDNLKAILLNAGYCPSSTTHPRLQWQDLKTLHRKDEILRVYRLLGGEGIPSSGGPGKWDMEFEGLIVELDEQRHFNRYRLKTLSSPIYSELTAFPLELYRRYCTEHERDCVRAGSHGGNWSNRSCERQFGPSSSPGILEGGGSARWKQRAFYDYMKDVGSAELGLPLVRLAIWDRVQVGNDQILLQDVLLKPHKYPGHGCVDLIQSRLAAGLSTSK
jgi:hypothetical protein